MQPGDVLKMGGDRPGEAQRRILVSSMHKLGHIGGGYSGRKIMNLFTDMVTDMFFKLKEIHAKHKKCGVTNSTESY